MDNKKISVVIPVWQGRKYLPDCLDALLAQDHVDLEIIVVDNASSDGSAEWVVQNYPQVQLIRNNLNQGFAGACNIGLGVARGDILILLNQDTQTKLGCLLALSRTLEDKTIGVAGCKILYPDGKTIQHAGGGINWPLGFSYHLGQGEIDAGAWEVSREVEYVTGAALAFRRDVFERVGLLDEGFWPGYFEDVDYCLRAKEQGYRVWYVSTATLIHNESTTIEDKAVALQFGHRGRLRLVLKHLPPEKFLDQFIPAEESNQLAVIRVLHHSQALRMAYLEGMLRADSILRERWQSNPAIVYQVVTALKYLYQQMWSREIHELTASTHLDNAIDFSQPSQGLTLPTAHEDAPFQSHVPLIGSAIARLRAFLYAVVARPVINSLVQQQQAINQNQLMALREICESHAAQLLCIQASEQRLLELADESAMLAGEFVRISLGISHQQAAPYRDRDLAAQIKTAER